MGIRTIAVYSDADAEMPHVQEADTSEYLGPSPARESYLHVGRLLDAARKANAAAIHPGYGFLSENAEFAEAVGNAGLAWVGPPPAVIRAMGLKDAAKRLMEQSGVPVTPGYLGEVQSMHRLRSEAMRIGFPVLIKAVAGGGGKGMRRVDSAEHFEEALEACRREASSYFGEDRVLLEKYITSPRHLEVQIFGDREGNVIHLAERDCSLQRRHQKVIEEAPAPGLDSISRAALTTAAIRAAKAVEYVGAGTVEFIADASDGLRSDRIWFMEMNTRLQVEHPVTELITGEDLVEWQLRVAAGEKLPKKQEEVLFNGHAMEARLCAENPSNNFIPSTGRLDHFELPTDIRIDGGVKQGCVISPYYDPMVAKLIVHGKTRAEAVDKLSAACMAVRVWPVKTNAAFLARAVSHPEFRRGNVNTAFIETHGDALLPPAIPDRRLIAAAANALLPRDPRGPWEHLTGFRIAGSDVAELPVEINGSVYSAIPRRVAGSAVSDLGADSHVLFQDGEAWLVSAPRPRVSGESALGDGVIVAPMPGTVTRVDVSEGEAVKKGQRLAVLEAMKMENVLVAPFDGVVAGLTILPGAQVQEGTVLMRLDPRGA